MLTHSEEMIMKFASRVALAAALVFTLVAPSARAQQVEVEIGESLVCDTQQQVERFAVLFDGNAQKTASAVNEEVKDPTACAVLTIAFVRGPEVATARTRNGTYQIMRILVLGVVIQGGIRAAQPAAFYSMEQIEERTA
jgi:hypothetical protein